MVKAGFLPGDPAKVILVIVAVLIQGILPFFGHAAIVKTLRLLIVPFVVLFAVLLGFAIPHAQLNVVQDERRLAGLHGGAGLHHRPQRAGLDRVRQRLHRATALTDTSKKGIVGWVFLGTAVPEILIMTLGAVVGTFVLNIGTGSGGLLPFAHQSSIPAWFVVVFLALRRSCSSSPSTASTCTRPASPCRPSAFPVKRYHAVLIDCVIALGVTMYAIFSSSFTTYLEDFVDIVIVWIAPWAAIFLVDWALRRFRYVPSELQNTGPTSLYWNSTAASTGRPSSPRWSGCSPPFRPCRPRSTSPTG